MGFTSYEPERDGDRTVVERRDPLVGSLLGGRFRISERIASGGFGAIYRARHLDSNCDVAIKVLLPAFASNPNLVARFRREGALLAMLRDDHTVRTFEVGESDGVLYIVMELLRGESLFERYRARGTMPWSRATTIARSACHSLAEAHALGIVHRDLKPANIYLLPHAGEDFVKILDFGIAKIIRPGTEDGDLTQAGQMIGTNDYMAPEQILGGAVDGRTDIYTLGVVMYELVTGRRPFHDAQGSTGLLAALLTSMPPSPSLFARIPPLVEHIIMKCLAREPQDRWHDVHELAAALDHLHGTHGPFLPLQAQAQPPARTRIARGSQHIVPAEDPPQRASQLTLPTYEMAHVVHRDAVMRRVLWALVLVCGLALAIAITHLV